MNWETRCIHTEIQNDEYLHSHFSELADDELSDVYGCTEEATQNLAKIMKDEYIEKLPAINDIGVGFSDILSGAMKEVDWMELAKGFMEAAAENYED